MGRSSFSIFYLILYVHEGIRPLPERLYAFLLSEEVFIMYNKIYCVHDPPWGLTQRLHPCYDDSDNMINEDVVFTT